MNVGRSSFSFTNNYEARFHQSPSPPCNFSFTGNYDADFYHSSSPPTPKSRIMSTCDQIFGSQRKLCEVWVPPDERSPRRVEDHHLRACHALSVREIDDVRETEQNEMDSKMRKILECQQQFKEDFTARMDAISNYLNGRIEAVTTHVRILDTQISQISRVQTVASIDTNQGYRSTPSEISETSSPDEAISNKNNAASSTPTASDDRHTSKSIDRHSFLDELPVLVIPPSVPYKSKVPYPKPRKSKKEMEDVRCRAMMNKIREELPDNALIETSPPIQRLVKRMVHNDLTPEEGALLTRDINAIFLNLEPKKKKQKKDKVIVSEQVSMPAFSVETLDDITAGYVDKLGYGKQASKLEDWSGDHLFSNRLHEEVHIRDKLLEEDVFVTETQIAELCCRKRGNTHTTELVSIDTIICVDRHPSRAEPNSSQKAVSQSVLNAASSKVVLRQKATHLPLPTPREKQRYGSSFPKTSPIINKTFKDSKTVLQLTKPRDSRRGLVSSFDDCAGKRSIPPIAKSHPLAVPKFLGKPHAPHAYKPPWMRRHLSKKHLLPPSEPPDT